MDRAAAQAEAVSTAEELGLEVLRRYWGVLYQIGHDEERGWWAARRGRVGVLLTAASPEELSAAMAADYGRAGQ